MALWRYVNFILLLLFTIILSEHTLTPISCSDRALTSVTIIILFTYLLT